MNKIAIALVLLAAGLLLVWPAVAAVQPGAKYAGGNLNLEAKNATVGELLETIARTAGVDIFVAPGFQTAGQKMTLQISDEPLEEAIRRILRGYNYAAIYEKEGNDFRIAALKIYPEGQASGAVVPLFGGGRTPIYEEKNRRGETMTILVNAGGDIVTHGSAAARRGMVGPSQTEVAATAPPSAGLQSPWFALQLQQEQAEVERFSELLMLRRQAEIATDPKQRQALAMVYADEAAKFQAFKKANMNKVESLKRINQFQEVTKQ
ncbi:MAG: STN domain-containing protein [Candidatus Aminicenantes bacterium]|nr:STN domain-containing protein [Candidatus Aminicenantes bacterium]